MDEHVRKLRAEVARLQHRRPRTAVRYPSGIRHKITALARERQARGAKVPTIARDVGVAPWTLALWLRKPSTPIMRAVDVVPDAPRESDGLVSTPVLVTPSGVRVEGLDPETLVAVLRALG
jgi:hypothetical protein